MVVCHGDSYCFFVFEGVVDWDYLADVEVGSIGGGVVAVHYAHAGHPGEAVCSAAFVVELELADLVYSADFVDRFFKSTGTGSVFFEESKKLRPLLLIRLPNKLIKLIRSRRNNTILRRHPYKNLIQNPSYLRIVRQLNNSRDLTIFIIICSSIIF